MSSRLVVQQEARDLAWRNVDGGRPAVVARHPSATAACSPRPPAHAPLFAQPRVQGSPGRRLVAGPNARSRVNAAPSGGRLQAVRRYSRRPKQHLQPDSVCRELARENGPQECAATPVNLPGCRSCPCLVSLAA
jgi:hypothetical protein